MDFSIFQLINGFALRYLWLDALGIFFAQYLPYVLLACLGILLLKNFKRYSRMVFLSLISAAFGEVLVQIIRFFWYSPRPFVENSVNLLFSHPQTNSFPSGHTTFFFALSAVVYFHSKKLGIVFLGASFLIGIARVFAGLHWFSDILGGMIIGFLTGFFLYKSFTKKTKNRD